MERKCFNCGLLAKCKIVDSRSTACKYYMQRITMSKICEIFNISKSTYYRHDAKYFLSLLLPLYDCYKQGNQIFIRRKTFMNTKQFENTFKDAYFAVHTEAFLNPAKTMNVKVFEDHFEYTNNVNSQALCIISASNSTVNQMLLKHFDKFVDTLSDEEKVLVEHYRQICIEREDYLYYDIDILTVRYTYSQFKDKFTKFLNDMIKQQYEKDIQSYKYMTVLKNVSEGAHHDK